MAVAVSTVERSADLQAFVGLPWQIYANSPCWVPPIRSQEEELLTPGRHPFWDNARRELFLARREGRVVGRIAAIVDTKYNNYAHEPCGAFGFFECEDDTGAAHALFDAAARWLAGQGMAFMRGPLNPSTNYTCGLLVDGFDLQPSLMMPWNHPYYARLLESWYLHKEEDLFAYRLDKNNSTPSEEVQAEIARLKADGRFTCRMADKSRLADDIHTMLDLYRESWAENWGFSPLSDAEADHHVRELKDILDREFFVLFFCDGKPAAGMVALPDLTPLLRRCNGSMGLMTAWHYFTTRKLFGRGYRIMLFGIRQKYRLHGLPLLLLDYMLEKARGREDLEWVEGSWVLEDNAPICDLIEDFGGKIVSRYRIYRRELSEWQ